MQNNHSPNDPNTSYADVLRRRLLAPGTPLKAVLVGFFIDIGGSMLAAALLCFTYGFWLANQGLGPDEVMAALKHIPTDSWVYVAGCLLGAGCSYLGGFWCARIVRRNEYRFGAILGGLSALFCWSWDGDVPQEALFAMSTFACVLLGTMFGRVPPSSAK